MYAPLPSVSSARPGCIDVYTSNNVPFPGTSILFNCITNGPLGGDKFWKRISLDLLGKSWWKLMTFNGNLFASITSGQGNVYDYEFFFDFRPLRSIKSSHHSQGIIIRRPFCFSTCTSAKNVPCDYLTPARVQSRGQRKGRMRKPSPNNCAFS